MDGLQHFMFSHYDHNYLFQSRAALSTAAARETSLTMDEGQMSDDNGERMWFEIAEI